MRHVLVLNLDRPMTADAEVMFMRIARELADFTGATVEFRVHSASGVYAFEQHPLRRAGQGEGA